MNREMEDKLHEGGRTLSEADRQFVDVLFRELEQFRYQAPKDRALMFYPLGSYQRYLIHKVTQLLPELVSYSIGDEKSRKRVVVCFKSKRNRDQEASMGQVSPKRPPDLRTSLKGLKGKEKSKTLGHNPAKSDRRGSDPVSKNKMGKYKTWGGAALKKREKSLDKENQVKNGDSDFLKKDAVTLKRDPKKHSKHHTKRSNSQPHLNDRPRRRRDSFGESSDQRYSEVDNLGRKIRRPVSMNSGSEKHSDKFPGNEPVQLGRAEVEVLRNGASDIYSSSEATDTYAGDPPYENYDAENEVPPSYKTSGTESKAKRNLKKIKRTNSTKSCPPLERVKRDRPSGETRPKKDGDLETFDRNSPVFSRKDNSDLTSSNGRNGATEPTTNPEKEKVASRHRKKREKHAPSKEYSTVSPGEILKPNFSTSPLALVSHSLDTMEPATINEPTEAAAIVENVHPVMASHDESPPLISSSHDLENLMYHHFVDAEKQPALFSSGVPLMAAEASLKSLQLNTDKECQTNLHGPLVDVMVTMYNTQKDAFRQMTPLDASAVPSGPGVSPLSFDASGSTLPSVASSAYEKLGEYMYKAMLNFQNTVLGGVPQPANGPAFPPLSAAIYAPMAPPSQPLYMPWTSYFPDPSSSHPQNVGGTCCHHTCQPESSVAKTPPRIQRGSSEDVWSVTPRDDAHHWHAKLGRHHHGNTDRKLSSTEGSMSPHAVRSSKATDEFELDVSLENTNPGITVADRGDGVVVYVSNRSSSTGGSSVAGSAHSLANDKLAHASPLGQKNDNKVLKNESSTSLSSRSKISTHAEEKDSRPKIVLKKDDGPHETKTSEDIDQPSLAEVLDFVNVPEIASEEVILSLGSAPLATMEDEFEDSVSLTSSRSSSHSDMSDDPRADSTNSLGGEDLSPLVGFDDSLEIACEDGSTEY